MGSQYYYKNGKDEHYRKLGAALTGDNYPIIGVSWHNAQAYVKWLNQNKAAGSMPGDYFIPSEAQWEYAARDGKEGKQYGFGDDGKQLGDYAWYYINSGGKPHEVGGKKISDYGLHDIHGNVWEWVQDCYSSNYNGVPTDGSAWEDGCNKGNERRGLRGGSWDGSNPANLRAAYRIHGTPSIRYYDVGVRVARTLP